jgi:hypothetical protein
MSTKAGARAYYNQFIRKPNPVVDTGEAVIASLGLIGSPLGWAALLVHGWAKLKRREQVDPAIEEAIRVSKLEASKRSYEEMTREWKAAGDKLHASRPAHRTPR